MSADHNTVTQPHPARPRPAPSVTAARYLSSTELHELTGTPQKARQAAWLRKNGWRFALDCFDRPRVARAYYDRRMVGIESADEPVPEFAGPNWGALGI